jgi:hypothetical protein
MAFIPALTSGLVEQGICQMLPGREQGRLKPYRAFWGEILAGFNCDRMGVPRPGVSVPRTYDDSLPRGICGEGILLIPGIWERGAGSFHFGTRTFVK